MRNLKPSTVYEDAYVCCSHNLCATFAAIFCNRQLQREDLIFLGCALLLLV